MYKKSLLFLHLLIIVCLTSCSNREGAIEYVPFQNAEDGHWGLISPTGHVLVSDEYGACPTMATCDRFWMMNEKGYYELYNTDKTPQRIGTEEYRYVSLFYKGKAFVSRRDKPISVINKDGATEMIIDKIEGKKITRIQNVSEGHAVAVLDTLQGMMNTKAEWVIKPNYAFVSPMRDGIALAIDNRYVMMMTAVLNEPTEDLPSDIKPGYFSLFNSKGERMLHISGSEYPLVSPELYNGHIAVGKVINGEVAWGIINDKGKVIVKPSPKYKSIKGVIDKAFIYTTEDETCGLNSFEGKELIRPIYKDMIPAGGDMVIASAEYDDEMRMRYMRIDGTLVTQKKFISAAPFLPSSHEYAFARSSEDRCVILNNKGRKLRDVPMIFNIYLNYGSDFIESDYINLNELIKDVNFSESALNGLNFGSSVREVLDAQARSYSVANIPKASDYSNTTTVVIGRDIDGASITETIQFPATLSKQTYRQERVIDYYDWWSGYYWYHTRNVPTGFVFNNINPSSFKISFDNYGILRGKLRPLYEALVTKFKKMGSITSSNRSATVFALTNGRRAVIRLTGTMVTAQWGKLPKGECNINMYDDNVREELKRPDYEQTSLPRPI